MLRVHAWKRTSLLPYTLGMPPSHHLAVTVSDESGKPLSVKSIVLKSGSAVSRSFSSQSPYRASVSSLPPQQYALCISFADRPEHVFPLSLVKQSTGLAPTFGENSPACCSLTRRSINLPNGETELTFTLSFTLGRAHSEAVLVSGWDYKGGARNRLYSESHRDDLYSGATYRTGAKASISKRINDATIVTLFDFETGHRLRMLKGSSAWFEMDRTLQGKIKTHTGYYKSDANARKRYLDDSISITHVYDYVSELGASAPGSLREFHIFSHAWAGGPVLANTHEDPIYKPRGTHEGQRDPHDKDPRTKDFNPVNMPRLDDFAAAFPTDATVKIWGCMYTPSYRNLIRATAQATSDTMKISYDWIDAEGTTTKTTTARKAKEYIRDTLLKSTYMARLSAAVGRGVVAYGAPPGMGADLRAIPVGKKTRSYMYINTFTYKAEFAFLRRTFGLVPDDTGYIAY